MALTRSTLTSLLDLGSVLLAPHAHGATATAERPPGGQLHWRAAIGHPDRCTRFVVVMTAASGADMLTLLGEDEVARPTPVSLLDTAVSSRH